MAQPRWVNRASAVTVSDQPPVVLITDGLKAVWYGSIIIIGGDGALPILITESLGLDESTRVERWMWTGWVTVVLSTGAAPTLHSISVSDPLTLTDHRIVQLPSLGTRTILATDSVSLGESADAAPIRPLFDIVTMTDSATVQRWLSSWAGAVNLIHQPKPADVMTVMDGRVVMIPSSGEVMTLTITVGEQLVNIIPQPSALTVDVGELLQTV